MTGKRCAWCDENSEIYKAYHDLEWGVPLHDDTELFEMLILEGMQAGLSWITILKKRDNFRKAFDGFDVRAVAAYDSDKVEALLQDSGIIRNRLKINAAIKNAEAFISIQEEFGSFDKYIWSFVNYRPLQNSFTSMEEIPAKTELSDDISKELKKRGMSFVGSTIIYAFMQAVGMVNDHQTGCFRYNAVREMGTRS